MGKQFQVIGENRVAYTDRGSGPAVVFIHGLPTSSYLWNYAIDRLEGKFRCIAPDLMGLGDTEAGAAADLTMPSQAAMVVSLLDRLGIERAALVAHDQGGAVAQIIATRHPERVTKLVLVDTVCYDNWPVAGVKLMQWIASLPFSSWFFGSMTLRSVANRLGVGFPSGFYDKSKAGDDIRREYERTVTSTVERVRRFKRFILAGDNRYTMELAPDLKKLAIPTLIVWAGNDPYIPLKWASKLAADIPGAEGPVVIPKCGHFVPWEKPDELADQLLRFLTGV